MSARTQPGALPRRPARRRFLFAALLSAAVGAWALDNPDSPDRTAAFLARALPFEERLGEQSGGAGAAKAGALYERFLDAELNTAYRQLTATLGGDARAALVESQRRWLAFRDSEGAFIDRNWTPDAFGSSAALSRAGYRTALVKQRVLTLLGYLQNYPDAPR